MKRFLTVFFALSVIGAGTFSSKLSSAQSASPWPTFHANPQHTGASPNEGPTSPSIANQWTLPAAINSSPAIDSSGTAYVGDDNGYLYAFNPSDPKKPLWSFKTNGPIVSSPTLSYDQKSVFVGSNDGSLYAVSTATGKMLWYVDLAYEVHASPTLSADGSTIFITNGLGNFRAVKVADGSKVWGPFNLGAPIPGSLTLSAFGSTIYVPVYNGYMYAIPVTGSNAGKSPVNTYYLTGHPNSTPVVDGNDSIYLTTSEGRLLAFNAGSTIPRWTFSVPSGTSITATPAIVNGILIFGDSRGTLYGLKQSDATPAWPSFAHVSGSLGSSPAVSANGLIYVGADDGNMFAFSLQTGQPMWQLKLDGPIRSSPALGPDGSLWAATQSGVLYRITSAPSATATATAAPPTRIPTATNVPTSTTPTVTQTPVATVQTTPPPLPGVFIDKVLVAHKVKGKRKSTRTVRIGEKVYFYVLYHVTDAPALVPSAKLTITKNGKTRKKPTLKAITYANSPAFVGQVTFRNNAMKGKAYAHFKLNLGSSRDKRDRKFFIKLK